MADRYSRDAYMNPHNPFGSFGTNFGRNYQRDNSARNYTRPTTFINTPSHFSNSMLGSNHPLKRPRSPRNTYNASRPQNQYKDLNNDKSLRPPQTSDRNSFSSARYEFYNPSHDLTCSELNVLDVKRTFPKLHIPADFFNAVSNWQSNCPMIEAPSAFNYFNNGADFTIMQKDMPRVCGDDIVEFSPVEPVNENKRFSARVVLLSCPNFEDILSRSVRECTETSVQAKISWLKLVQFLVCVDETSNSRDSLPFLIGGPWCPTLDGANPEKDETVLMNTAKRTCYSQIGLDISKSSEWLKFMEIHYYRQDEQDPTLTASFNSVNEKSTGHLETVVVFLVGVNELMLEARESWSQTVARYTALYEQKLEEAEPQQKVNSKPINQQNDQSDIVNNDDNQFQEDTINDCTVGNIEDEILELDTQPISRLDVRSLRVVDLKSELQKRGIDVSNMVKSQLITLLQDTLDNEEKQRLEQSMQNGKPEEIINENLPAPLSEKDKRKLERQYKLDIKRPAVLVYGDIESRSLLALLDSRSSTESSFECVLFAEQFRDFIMRDAAFTIYKALCVYDLHNEALTEEEPAIKRSKSIGKIKFTSDPHLLFAFSIFDTGRTEMIRENDVEAILTSLGTLQSRSQTRKLITKVSGKRDIINYRRLTDQNEGSTEEPLSRNACLDDPDYLRELTEGNGVLMSPTEPQPNIIVTGFSNRFQLLLDSYKTKADNADIISQLSELRKDLVLVKTTEQSNLMTIDQVQKELSTHREKLREARSNQRHYSRLLKMASDLFCRVHKEISSQINRDQQNKESNSMEVATPVV